MRHLVPIFILLFICTRSSAQRSESSEDFYSNQLEDLAELEETDSEDEYNLQQLSHFKKHPVSLNGSPDELRAFPLFDALMVENLLEYRRLLGNLVSIYELQAVPGFSIETMRNIQHLVTVHTKRVEIASLRKKLTTGERSIIVRPVLLVQDQDGFSGAGGAKRFAGSKPGLYLKYKYAFQKTLQYGILLEKDAGEPMLPGKAPFFTDFQSGHFLYRNSGKLKTIVLGDYTVNLGQGLIHWQSQAFKKTSSVLNIKRQSEALKPYLSAGEFNFFRGAAATFNMRSTEATIFVSYRSLTANTDFNEEGQKVITSFNASGLHRTSNEISDKNAVEVFVKGLNIKWKHNRGHVGINVINYSYSVPIEKASQPYNIYSVKGNRWMNASIDFSRTVNNYHFFGEMAIDKTSSIAILNGVIASINQHIDVALLYRNISSRYQSISGNAFTENTLPQNEQGIYAGLSMRPAYSWRIDIYADVFRFPWMKFRSDAPSDGWQYLIQMNWKPSKSTELYTRFRGRERPLNISDNRIVDYPVKAASWNWRSHINFKRSKSVELRWRVEITSFEKEETNNRSNGYLFYTDFFWRPARRNFSLNNRIQYFEADDYDSRIYAYENDLLYVSATPSYYDKGLRHYINIKHEITTGRYRKNHFTISLKLGSTLYSNKNQIGSGGSTIQGKGKTDIRIQLIFTPAS